MSSRFYWLRGLEPKEVKGKLSDLPIRPKGIFSGFRVQYADLHVGSDCDFLVQTFHRLVLQTVKLVSSCLSFMFRAKEKEKARGRVKRQLKQKIRAQRKTTAVKQMKQLPSCDVWMFLRVAVVSQSLKVIVGKSELLFVITRL